MKTRAVAILIIMLSAWLLQACSAQTIPSNQWDGSWDSHAFNEFTSVKCSIDLKSSGEAINGTFDCSGGFITGTISGTLSPDHSRVTGTYVDSIDPKRTDTPFEWQLNPKNPDQFSGNHETDEGRFAWCGARPGVSLPDPCLGP